MRLRNQLALAFFLLAVVPLTGLTAYSYYASSQALRRAVALESEDAAMDMERRVALVRTELDQRLRGLRHLPFLRLIGPEQETAERMGEREFYQQMMEHIGDAAVFLEHLEFTPDQKAMAPVPPPVLKPEGGRSAGVMIYLTGPAGSKEPEVQSAVAPPPPRPPAVPEEAPRQRKRVMALKEQIPAMVDKALSAAKAAAMLAGSSVRADQGQDGMNLECDVERAGEMVGRLEAKINMRHVLGQILPRSRAKAGEIPFVVDREGNLYSSDDSDLARLGKLQAAGLLEPSGDKKASDPNWVVVTRRDPQTGVLFGMARPVGEAIQDMRRASLQTFGLGLGLIGLAMVGIIPLSRRITRNLSCLTHGVGRLAKGDLEVCVPVHSRDEFGDLAQAFNKMAADLRRNQAKLLEQEALKKELEMCREIQRILLPQKALRNRVAESVGLSIPAREVGGDFFNYFTLPSGDMAVLIGDVSGKGVPAALMMANLQATIRSRILLTDDLAVLASELDRELAETSTPESYLTLFLGIIQTQDRVFRWVNAGHPFPFLLRASGEAESLEATGRPIGLVPGGDYQEKRTELQAGDLLFLYTDGLTDTLNAAGADFGVSRLRNLLSGAQNLETTQLLDRTRQSIDEFRGDVEIVDDATMVALRIRGGGGPEAGWTSR